MERMLRLLEVAPSATVAESLTSTGSVSSTAVMLREMEPGELVSWLVPSVAT